MKNMVELREAAAVAEIVAALPERLHAILHRQLANNADGPALSQGMLSWSYRELFDMCEYLVVVLKNHGVRPGDRVMIVGENSLALVALLFAVSSIDAWVVIVNVRLSSREIDTIREHCGARLTIFLVGDSAEADVHATRLAAMSIDIGSAGIVRISALNEDCRPDRVYARGDEQVAALIYTSGTTGNPKGVMLTHHNLLFIAAVSSTLRNITSVDRVYGVLPISHVYGLASVCLGSLFGGACVRLEPRYTPEKMIEALVNQGITVCQGVPAMYAKLLEKLRAESCAPNFPSLRFIYAGGSPLHPLLKRDIEAQLGLTLNNGYGMTEASPTVSQTRFDEHRTDCSVGRVIPGVEVRIVNQDANDVAGGEVGELWVRGPNVMKGYYRNLELTASTINAEGWLSTGDLAHRDAAGALFIVGRTKDLIIRSGFNVYPVEVEEALNSHADVTQSAVVGYEVDGNEQVVAFVERASGSNLDEIALMDFAAKSLAPYKRPTRIIFMSPLPHAASGKLLKHLLKSMISTSLS